MSPRGKGAARFGSGSLMHRIREMLSMNDRLRGNCRWRREDPRRLMVVVESGKACVWTAAEF